MNLNKPLGLTSRRVVDRVVATLGRGVKVGHAGTLDPMATGVLVVCIGPATRLIEYVQRQSKTYRTVVLLGARSDTHDADGQVAIDPDATAPSIDAINAALAGQVGRILQKPPEYSALRVEGRRAYDLARAGHAVELAPRPVVIHRIDVISYVWPRLALEVACEGGTYIRSIARDVGESLGCGGLVEELVRTRIGAFTLADAIELADVSAATILGLIRPSAEAVAQLPSVGVTAEQVADLARGRSIELPEARAGELALIGPDGTLVAVAEADPQSGKVAPKRVLVQV